MEPPRANPDENHLIASDPAEPASKQWSPEELVELVYPELRRAAAASTMLREPAPSLAVWPLVHEAWLRLQRSNNLRFRDKAHFFSTAAETMRRVLVDRARRRQAIRHGAKLETVELDKVEIATPANDERLLQVHEALDGLSAEDPVKAQVVKCRFFVGMNEQEIAQALGLSERTVERHWAYAKAWLYSAMNGKQ